MPGLDPDLKLGRRLIEILALALVDCLGEKPAIPPSKIPVLVGLAEEGRPEGGAALADTIVAGVQAKLGLRFHPTLWRAIPKGHTAGFEALRIVRELFQNPDIPACFVCGVDSYINASSLLWLDQNWRLKTPANQHGLIPGEAAAAVLLQRAPADGAVVEVVGLGFGKEQAHVLSEEPLLGLGLTEAAQCAGGGEARLPRNGLADFRRDRRAIRIQKTASSRRQACACGAEGNSTPLALHDSIGDTGAAAGVAQLVVANHAFRKRHAPGDKAICLSSSVPGDRAAAVVRWEKR